MPDGSWKIKTQEDYQRRQSMRPGVRLSLIAKGPHFESLGLRRLGTLTPITWAISKEQLAWFDDQRTQQAMARTDEQPLWFRFVGELQICLDADLEGKLREFQSLGQDTDSLWLVEVDALLSQRLAFMRALFAQRYANEAVKIEDFAGFPTASDLMQNSSGSFAVYFSPILLLNSPWVGGFSAMRPYANVVRLLKVPEIGRSKVWTDLLDTFQPNYAGSARAPVHGVPAENLGTREHLLEWWVAKVSELLWVLSDPTRHLDGEGSYDPSSHLGATLTVEKIFVTAAEIMRLKSKDEVLRKILLFDLLDLLEGGGMGTYESNLSYGEQHEKWASLKATLPEPVARAVAPVVEGAFKALMHVEDGFWSGSRRTSDGLLLISTKDGTRREGIAIDRARGEYVRVLRNSHHGFGKIAKNPRGLSYLASHTGALDNSLPDLIWWYLIRLLADPSVVAPTWVRPRT
ncbi:MAG TPA: hypothetical protein VMV52_05870 [Candidatus Nanopelagicaceae bacterium]|nr:hypothetical protein [Candidatus Nanopelagicaceae bacterium]